MSVALFVCLFVESALYFALEIFIHLQFEKVLLFSGSSTYNEFPGPGSVRPEVSVNSVPKSHSNPLCLNRSIFSVSGDEILIIHTHARKYQEALNQYPSG